MKTQITAYCTPEQKEEIKSLAKKESCSLSDFIIAKLLNLKLKEQKEKVYTQSARRYIPKVRKRI